MDHKRANSLRLLSILAVMGLTSCSPPGADASKPDGGAGGGAGGGDTKLDGGAGGGGTKLDGGASGGLTCSKGYTCYPEPGTNVVWAMKNDGNVNGPTCNQVCEGALSQSCAYHACDENRPVAHTSIDSFQGIAAGLGFKCKKGDCWPDAPGDGLYLVSIKTDADGSKSCFFPDEAKLRCSTDPGNANCFGERYASICPCVPKPLDQACKWDCPPNHTTQAVWRTSGTSCAERINYWRKKACEEHWVECPPAGLPPMVECTACHECANSEAEWDSTHGAHKSFTRCGEFVQGEGGGATCADVIDSFVSERAPDKDGVMRCEGHCGPILSPGCQTFFWGKARNSSFHTLNWDSCNAQACKSFCDKTPGACFTVATSPSLTCDDPNVGKEPGPVFTCP
jgi:hypothetical protein